MQPVDPVGLASSLARPVAAGHLSIENAHAAILRTISRGLRTGTLPGTGSWDDWIQICNHALTQQLENHEARRAGATGAIKHVLRRLIDEQAPSNALLAAAHDRNGFYGFPLTEGEVTAIARSELNRTMRSARYG